MTEHPIIMTAESVRAVLDGRKTQTRRVLKPQPVQTLPHTATNKPAPGWELIHPAGWRWNPPRIAGLPKGWSAFAAGDWSELARSIVDHCPYGRAGDRLWVRESWGLHRPYDFTDWHRDPVRGTSPLDEGWELDYRADWAHDHDPNFWRSPRFMPRWASRLTLELTSVRVQRVQDISEDDARAEGIQTPAPDGRGYPSARAAHRMTLRSGFSALWDTINGKRAGCSWIDNPWVWVLGFRRVEEANG